VRWLHAGQIVNQVLVVCDAPPDQWGHPRVECDCLRCGKQGFIVHETSLTRRKGRSRSCGCWGREMARRRMHRQRGTKSYSFVDLTGTHQPHGRLEALECVGFADDGKFRHAQWRCRCDCGNLTVIRGNAFTTEDIKSCGVDCPLGRIDLTGIDGRDSSGREALSKRSRKNAKNHIGMFAPGMSNRIFTPAARSQGGTACGHKRWHLARGVSNSKCSLCRAASSQPVVVLPERQLSQEKAEARQHNAAVMEAALQE
jgi:hypothetical protein